MRLDGVRVLDLTHLLPGPYATQLLADMGAEVIKIEDTDMGDYARYTEPMIDGTSGMFSMVNRGKKSVTLDLKNDDGREAFYRLAEDADVVFEQFRPGVADRLGVGYDDVKERNPDIVYCSLSGYGGSGPYRERVGHDLNYVGFSGFLDMTRRSEDEKPPVPGYPVADMSGGLFAAFSIVSSLLSRELGGGGDRIDVSMTDVVTSFSQSVAPLVFNGDDPRPGETSLTGGYPWYDVYETADGRYVTLAALEPKFWNKFCDAVGREDLVGYHMTSDEDERDHLRNELEEMFAEKTRDEWEEELGDKEVMFGVVNTPEEAVEDPQIRDRVVKDEGEIPRVGFPAISSDEMGGDENVPERGEHTREVLGEFYDDDEIDGLSDSGAI